MQHEVPKQQETPIQEEFVTDTQRIVRRHLENENDVITDDDIRSVRIGITPHLQEASEEKMNEMGAESNVGAGNHDSGGEGVTPWDAVQ